MALKICLYFVHLNAFAPLGLENLTGKITYLSDTISFDSKH